MLGFVQNWFGPRCNPVGVDFGTDSLRMAQVQWLDGDWRLIAAACADVPAAARKDPAARAVFFSQTTRELLAAGKFHGKSVMLNLPAAAMHIQHLRMAKMGSDDLKRALPWEARGKIPFDPNKAALRHVVAGEVYVDQELRHEVILMAAAQESVDHLLAAAAKARLDVVGMNVEPMAILDCFCGVYRRQSDLNTTNGFIDIGASGSRAIFTRGRQILFARNIEIGGNSLTAAVADFIKLTPEEARNLRAQVFASPSTNPSVLNEGPNPQAEQVQLALEPLVTKFVDELNLCRRYYEATFPATPLDRLVFIGGEARNRWLCQQIAKQVGLAALLGDPMCRMNKSCDLAPESGIDRRQAQPAWAVAIGLSIGPNIPAATAHGPAPINHENRSSHERV